VDRISAVELRSVKAATGIPVVSGDDAGSTTGTVQMHRMVLQRSEFGSWELWFGQHGCTGATGICAIAAQVRDAERKATSRKQAENLLNPCGIAFEIPGITGYTSMSVAELVRHTLTLAMQTEDAAQYRPRLQSPAVKQAIADPRLQSNNRAGKIKRF
jgi:hypothetical protein